MQSTIGASRESATAAALADWPAELTAWIAQVWGVEVPGEVQWIVVRSRIAWAFRATQWAQLKSLAANWPSRLLAVGWDRRDTLEIKKTPHGVRVYVRPLERYRPWQPAPGRHSKAPWATPLTNADCWRRGLGQALLADCLDWRLPPWIVAGATDYFFRDVLPPDSPARSAAYALPPGATDDRLAALLAYVGCWSTSDWPSEAISESEAVECWYAARNWPYWIVRYLFETDPESLRALLSSAPHSPAPHSLAKGKSAPSDAGPRTEIEESAAIKDAPPEGPLLEPLAATGMDATEGQASNELADAALAEAAAEFEPDRAWATLGPTERRLADRLQIPPEAFWNVLRERATAYFAGPSEESTGRPDYWSGLPAVLEQIAARRRETIRILTQTWYFAVFVIWTCVGFWFVQATGPAWIRFGVVIAAIPGGVLLGYWMVQVRLAWRSFREARRRRKRAQGGSYWQQTVD